RRGARARLLRQLWLDEGELSAKYRFVAAHRKPNLGIGSEDFSRLATSVTHVVHCAASVAFDDPYETSFRANVLGALNALRFSQALQAAPGSVFVAHLAIETSYIHGRQVYALARENEINFPRNYYNNYYELTKAMASIEAEHFMLASGLRLTQLCPSIVIGEAASGNNRGDTKVVNAPVNLFGRAFQGAERKGRGGWVDRSKASMLAHLACFFPGDPSAQINLITVDRVAAGILAALKRPEAIGERIHLANDRRITPEQMARIVSEELGVKIKLTEPTLHRTVALPLLTRVLKRLKQERVAQMIQKMTNVFGGYSEWGQPVHEVGNDVRVLGLPAERPDVEDAFRMLCRHNRWVQGFGKVKDADELSRRERRWREFLRGLEERTGQPACRLPPEVFAAEVARGLSYERG
ncbi:MAG: NAD-dependent epimerase/dehydratase family protein, partial [Thermoanaerobaculia bacterium]|nr:NAD-dependent epimerase/dehydratase family protein [Thermoanaerobaculia bacterium]